MSELADAIRAWEESRALMKGAMAAWEVARGGPEVWDLPRSLYAEAARVHAEEARDASGTTLAARDMALRALEAAEDRESEARHEAACLMPPAVAGGIDYEDMEGVIVDGRFYFRYDNEEIHSMKVADPPAESPPVAEDVCPDCGRDGLDYGPLCMIDTSDVEQDLACPDCGRRWTDRYSKVGRRPLTDEHAADSPLPTKPTQEPDDDWKPCDMTCPGCKEAGHVFYHILYMSDFASGGWRKNFWYECRKCGHAWCVMDRDP